MATFGGFWSGEYNDVAGSRNKQEKRKGALQNGVDVKTVSNMLGHYNAVFTLSTYAHATSRMQEEAAEKMGSFIAQSM